MKIDKLTVRWEPRDVWVGLYWDRRADGTHYYVCLVPCVVIHWVRTTHSIKEKP